jgi:hypothetical protein
MAGLAAFGVLSVAAGGLLHWRRAHAVLRVIARTPARPRVVRTVRFHDWQQNGWA